MKSLRFILACMMALSLLVGCDGTTADQSSKEATSLLALSAAQGRSTISEEQAANLSAALINNSCGGAILNSNVFSNNLFAGIISATAFDTKTLLENLLQDGKVLIHWEPGLHIYISVDTRSPYGVKFEFIFDHYWAKDLRAPLETCTGTLVSTVETSGSDFFLTLDGTVTFNNTVISVDPVVVSIDRVRLGFEVINAVVTEAPVFVMDGTVKVDGRGIALDAVREAISAIALAAAAG